METGNYRLASLGFGWSERLLSRHAESDQHSRNIVVAEGEFCDRLYSFEKSAKNVRAEQFPVSTISCIAWSK